MRVRITGTLCCFKLDADLAKEAGIEEGASMPLKKAIHLIDLQWIKKQDLLAKISPARARETTNQEQGETKMTTDTPATDEAKAPETAPESAAPTTASEGVPAEGQPG